MIWLVGCSGMLGSEILKALEKETFPFVATNRSCDITDWEVIRSFCSGKPIKWIINCSAYTAVDKAEDEKDSAYRINVLGVENLGRIARELGASIIHISTDYVFDGKKEGAYSENDEPQPQSVYGLTKWQGEVALMKMTSQHFIIRTSWLYGEFGPNFVYTMLRLMKERSELKVVSDQKGTPTWTFDLASIVMQFISSENHHFGVYHYSGDGCVSWYDFALRIQKEGLEKNWLDKAIPLYPITTSEYPTKAKRPANSLMSKEKIKRTLNIGVPSWEVSLSRFMQSVTDKRTHLPT